MTRTRTAPEGEHRGRGGPNWLFERRLWAGGLACVAGVDEAGRGPLAGPVVAAATAFHPGDGTERLAGLNDSKCLSPLARARLAPRIRNVAAGWAVAAVDPTEIDAMGIGQASLEAMRRAVALLRPLPQHVLVDGPYLPRLQGTQTAVIGGDGLCCSIAAASVLAKVQRDALMEGWDLVYPGYGFAVHRGYPTAAHRAALRRLGPCPLHRRSFRLEG